MPNESTASLLSWFMNGHDSQTKSVWELLISVIWEYALTLHKPYRLKHLSSLTPSSAKLPVFLTNANFL